MDCGLEEAFQTGTLNNIWFSTKTIPREVGMQPGHKNQNKIEILTSLLDFYPKLYSLNKFDFFKYLKTMNTC